MLELDSFEASDGVSVTASALLPLPDDPSAWIDDSIGEADRISDTQKLTRTGWSVRIVLSRAGDSWRAHAFYAFFEHAAVAVITATSRQRLDAYLEVLETGTPRWTNDVAALVELWDVPPATGT